MDSGFGKKAINIFGNIIFASILLITLFVGFYVVKSKLDGGVPMVAGNKLYIVLSGSMAPVFDAGSLVGVKDILPEEVEVGDIVTFQDPADAERVITHRVLEIKENNGALSFVTKGDANDAQDPELIPEENILGRVSFSIPYIGYLTEFTRSKKGIVLLLIIPGVIFIATELVNLFKLAGEYEEEQKKHKAEAEGKESKV
jgi:signal peptidase